MLITIKQRKKGTYIPFFSVIPFRVIMSAAEKNAHKRMWQGEHVYNEQNQEHLNHSVRGGTYDPIGDCRQGFTLIEIVAAIIILGILLAIAIPKYFTVPQDAADAALKTAVTELNARENLAWGKWRSDRVEYTVDEIKADLRGFAVSQNNTIIGSENNGRKAVVTRTEPSETTPGRWKILQFID